MRRNTVTLQAVVLLGLIGVTCVGLRYQSRADLRRGLVDRAWRLIYSIEAEAEDPGAVMEVALPSDTPHVRVFRQDYRHTNLRVSPMRDVESDTRQLLAIAEEDGDCRLTFRFDLHLSPEARWKAGSGLVAQSEDVWEEYLEGDDEIQVDSPAVREALEQLRAERIAPARLPQRFAEFCCERIAHADRDAPRDAEAAIEEGLATPIGRARAMVALCRAAGIPSRPVAGFEIVEQHEGQPRFWVEALLDDQWSPYDPGGHFLGELPSSFLPVCRGDVRIVRLEGMDEFEAEYSIVPLPGTPHAMATGDGSLIDVLDLTRLPLELHDVLSLILLMPLGALVTCVFRNVIGIPTSGTFTPTLLALSFVYADWRTGLLVLAAVIVLGFATRNALDRLKLLMLPRLSIVLTLVVCCLVFGLSLLDYFRLTPSVQAVLLPMVILTMIVERFYVTTQEDGMAVAVQRLAGTTAVGLCCYLVFQWRAVAGLLLVYPELHLFTVAALVVIGRYTGYQLLEPWRFRDTVDFEPGGPPR